ncbi:hypothetical protein NF320_000670 [Salmonella enterica]|uniref:hypothetical protein n=1 Tax=Salmonella bongori TaxID=54736 RepID=UPI00112F6006|nr:hypothetical protein [Salmonella bongori]EAT2265566.1 hypothetical protein [Salmonella enterica]EGE4660903.1 hypothetical protein [Salmonella bongori serovar 48:i:- str. 94-0708]EBF1983207.1 hypothetical protein [Salmonella enterica]EBR3615792.1 hypothetical protein [Salmonella enterica]ECS0473810.1 hypothetical protein [Salmonella enterica]
MNDTNNVTGNICDTATNICNSVTLSLNSVPVIFSSSGTDFKVSAGYFAAAFIPTLSLWLVAKSSGIILEFIRRL